MNFIDDLTRLDACSEAVDWARQFESLEAAWAACERGDWMLWYAGMLAWPPGDERRKPLVLCACECARLALPYVPDGEDRPRVAIETAEAWARGDPGVSLEDVRVAAEAAYADAAAAAYAAGAAYAAAYAAGAAGAAYATAVAARQDIPRACADIVRKYYPKPPKGVSYVS